MLKSSVILCLFLAALFVSGTYARVDTNITSDWTGWNPIPVSEIPVASPSDVIEVRHVLAPLMKAKMGDLLALLKLYHTGVVFLNKNTNKSLTIEFDAIPSVYAVLLPDIHRENGNITLKWQENGAAMAYHGIDFDYWSVEMKTVATINGSLFNTFVNQFLASANHTHSFYNLWNVYEHWGGNQYIESWTCFDFAYATVDFLYQNGAKLNYATGGMKKDMVNLYSVGRPVAIAYETEKDYIDDFFQTIELKFRHLPIHTILEEAIDVINLFEGKIYYHFEEVYYRIHLHDPYLDVKVIEQPLPGSPAKPELLHVAYKAAARVNFPN